MNILPLSQPETSDLQHPVNRMHHNRSALTLGQRAAETMAAWIGSWRFLISQSVVLAVWVGLNTVALIHHIDPFPYILLNLGLSMQAAMVGPVLLISSNRSAARDRDLAEHTYQIEVEMNALLRSNTELTQIIHTLTTEMYARIIQPATTLPPQY